MKSFFWLFALIGLLCASLKLPPQIDTIAESMLLQKYNHGEALLQNGSLPIEDSLFLLAMLRSGKVVDYESYAIDGKDIIKMTEIAEDTFLPLLSTPDSLKGLYYLGMSLGYRGLCQMKMGDLFGGAKSSGKSVEYLERLVKHDSMAIEAYSSIGLYKYYLQSSLKWVPFTGKKENGLNLVEKAFKGDKWYNISAKQSLFWIYIDEKRYEDAQMVIDDLKAIAPKNSVVLRAELKLFTLLKRYRLALKASDILADLSRNRDNWADYLWSQRAKALALFALKKHEEAQMVCQKALGEKIPAQSLKIEWVQKHQKEIKKLLKRRKRD